MQSASRFFDCSYLNRMWTSASLNVEGMACSSQNPTTLAEDQDQNSSQEGETTTMNNDISTGGGISDMNLPISVDANNQDTEESLEDNKNHLGENVNSSILDITALSDTSSSLEYVVSEDAHTNTQNQRKRNSRALTLGMSLLVGIIVGLTAFGIGKAVGRDKGSTQAFQAVGGQHTTNHPSGSPSVLPSTSPSPQPTYLPTQSPTIAPTVAPTTIPTAKPTNKPTPAPTNAPSVSPTLYTVTYVPGNLTREEAGLLLSEGLRARIIARSGEAVKYHDGSLSEELFHGRPDFGATFADTRPFNEGGWVYTSNSEMPEEGAGGVGSITFNKRGTIIDYRMVLLNTTMNCGGGKSPWGTWISCEEVEFFGEIYQVDPFGEIEAEKATIGSQLGRWESFAYDVRDPQDPKFFATEDHNKGTVRRFRPEQSMIDWDRPWDMLHADGVIDYLIIYPDENMTGGTFDWIDNIEQARNNARSLYPQSEGIDVYKGNMFVVCKGLQQMFTFDLDEMTYYNQSTVSGLFDGGPDQMKRILDGENSDLLYFTEEGGVDAGIHARDELGRFYTILESPIYPDETTGLAFSPGGEHMYVAYQETGFLFDIWREDGLPFGGRTLDVKYHQTASPGGT